MRTIALVAALVCACGDVVTTANVTISPASPLTTDDLVASTDDTEGRALTFRWSKGGSVQTGAKTNTLSADITAKGDVWKVEALDDGDLVGSASVTIGNSPPTVAAVTLPMSPVAGAALVCAPGIVDLDEEPLQTTTTWMINGAPFTGTTGMTTRENDTLVPGTTHTGDVVSCSVKTSDGTAMAMAQGAAITVAPRIAYFIRMDLMPPVLRKIDLDTKAISDIGQLTVQFQYGDLTWDRANQRLLMVDGRGAKGLYSINPTNAVATLIGLHNLVDVFSVAASPTGAIYAVATNNTLYSLDPTTGVPTSIGPMAATVTNGQMEGFVYDTKRQQFVGQTTGGNFYSIDVTAATGTLLGPVLSMNDLGLTYDPYVDRYWAMDYSQRIQMIDPTANYAGVFQTVTAPGAVTAIAIPLPLP